MKLIHPLLVPTLAVPQTDIWISVGGALLR
jgi:hypothetical protein